jgi:hypothetical protein
VGLEAGLASPDDVERLVAISRAGVRWLRLLVEIDGIEDDAGVAAALLRTAGT